MNKTTTTTNRKTATVNNDFYIIKADDLQPLNPHQAQADRITAMYAQAEKCVYIALRARHEKSGLQFLADLQNAQHQDQTARNNPRTAERITDLEKAHQEHRDQFNFFNAQSHRLTLTDQERATAFYLAQEYKHKAQAEQDQIDALYNSMDNTYSDRADLTQTALLKMLELEKTPAPITAQILATYGATDQDELTAEQLTQAQDTANFKAVINCVGKAINQLATPEALNRYTTKAEPIDLDTVADYIDRYGIEVLNGLKIPHTAKRTRASDCYITIEERDTKTQKGYYKVTHYKTIAPYQYIEQPTDNESTETDIAYLKSYNPFVSNFADIERIEQLCTKANLTDRQRLFLEHFARRCRIDGDFKSVKQYAFKQIGITTTTNQSTFFNRLKKALLTATK